jgi:hypothetical protein
MNQTIATILALALSVAACGSVENEAAPDGDPGAPPAVLSVEPADGEQGVKPDAVITVVFDRAMDPDSVRAAWSSELMPAEAVTFSWNQAGDRLTVDPIEPLPVAQGAGWDPDVIEAERIDFAIGTSARDAAGQAMADRFDSSLYTVRRLTVVNEHDPLLTDSRTGLSAGDDPADVPFIYAGDTNANVRVKAVASFWIPLLSGTAVLDEATVEQATLTAEQVAAPGSPYDLGELEVWQIEFATLDSAYSAGPIARMGILSTDDGLGPRSTSVGNAVLWAQSGGEPVVQFRLEFTTATDDDDTLDAARFDKSSLTLAITYVTP